MNANRRQHSLTFQLGLLIWAVIRLGLALLIGVTFVLLALPSRILPIKPFMDVLARALKWLAR